MRQRYDENQLEFDWQDFARHTDPDTSKKAGARIRKENPKRFRAGTKKAIIFAEYGDGEGLTDTEAMYRVCAHDSTLHPAQEGWRRRCSDLRAEGLIEDTGERRKNFQSPDESMVCKITLKGALALKCLAETGWSERLLSEY